MALPATQPRSTTREYEVCARCVAPETNWSHAEILAGFARREAWLAAELAAVQAFVAPSRAHAAKLSEDVTLDPARVSVIAHGLPEPLARVVRRGWDGRGPLRVLFLRSAAAKERQKPSTERSSKAMPRGSPRARSNAACTDRAISG